MGAMLPPPRERPGPSHGNRSSAAGGWLVEESLSSKQSPPAEGAASASRLGRSCERRCPDLVPAGRPEVRVHDGDHRDAVCRLILHEVPDDAVASAARHDDAHAVGDVPVLLRVHGRRVVVVDVIARDDDVFLRRERLRVEGVRHDPTQVLSPLAVHDREVPTRVRPRIAEGVVFGEHVGDDGVARLALTDVEAGIGRPGSVGVIELPPRDPKA